MRTRAKAYCVVEDETSNAFDYTCIAKGNVLAVRSETVRGKNVCKHEERSGPARHPAIVWHDPRNCGNSASELRVAVAER